MSNIVLRFFFVQYILKIYLFIDLKISQQRPCSAEHFIRVSNEIQIDRI